ncbi:MAG: cupin domain-containing protein [Ignavibacteriae bacterium]|nr:cupin domain-containing protein [Ignavibacteriota bacterium]
MIDIVHITKSKKPTVDELKSILKRAGLESDLYSDRPGTKYGRHKHDFDDFIVIVQGQMKIGTDQGEWLMKPGDRLDLPKNTVHWAEMVGKEEVQYLSAAK